MILSLIASFVIFLTVITLYFLRKKSQQQSQNTAHNEYFVAEQPSTQPSTRPLSNDEIKKLLADDRLARNAHKYAMEKYCKYYGMDYDKDSGGFSCKMTEKGCNTAKAIYDRNSSYSHTVEWHPEAGGNGKCVKVYKFYTQVCDGISKSQAFTFNYVPGKYKCEDNGICSETVSSTCNIPKSYCDYKGVGYSSADNGNCYISSTQNTLENLYGTYVIRKIMAHNDPTFLLDVVRIPSNYLINKVLGGGYTEKDWVYSPEIIDCTGFNDYDGIVLPKNLYDSNSKELFINKESAYYPFIISENKLFYEDPHKEQKAMMMYQTSKEKALGILYGKNLDKPEPQPYVYLNYLIDPGYQGKDFEYRSAGVAWTRVNCKDAAEVLVNLFVIDFRYASQPDCSNPVETLYRMFKNVILMNLEVRFINTISVDPSPYSQERFYKYPGIVINIPFTITKAPDDPDSGYTNPPLLAPEINTLVRFYDLDYRFNSSKGTTTKILIAAYEEGLKFCNQYLTTLIEDNRREFSKRLVHEPFVVNKMDWIKDIFSRFGTYNIKFYESDQFSKYFDVGDRATKIITETDPKTNIVYVYFIFSFYYG